MDELNISREDLSRLVFTDDLTGLYNRRYLYQFLKSNVNWGDPSGPPLSLLMLDLDHFKAYNDTFGHLDGDKLLQKISGMIRETAGESAVPIRYAGDEFTVLMSGTPRHGALAVGESIRSRIAAERISAEREGKPVEIGVSVGVAVFPDDGTTAEKLLDAADRALYHSKNTGKNKVSSVDALDDQSIAGAPIFDTFLCSTYIAPVDIMETLREVVETARLRASACAVIHGESGMGKTRLLLELVKLYQPQGIVCLLERCAEENAGAPYRALLSLLDRYLEGAPTMVDRVRKSLPPTQVTALQRVLKSLRSTGEPPPPESDASRVNLYDGLLGLLALLSSDAPILLLFDEFHHADAGTLEVMKGLVELEKGNVAICGVVPAVTGEGRIGRLESTLADNARFRRIDLRPLGDKEIALLVTSILTGSNPSPEFVSLIREKTKGIPLYLQEAVKGLLKRRKIILADEGWKFESITTDDIPETLEESIRSELTGLDDEARTVLEKAAVIGPNFQFNVLNAIGGRNEGETLDLIDKAKRLNLIESATPLDDERLIFTSSTLRNASYEAIDEKDRQELHRKVGEVAERQFHDNPGEAAHLLAHHFSKGGDEEKAQKYTGILQSASDRVFRQDEIARHVEKEKRGVFTRIDEATKPLPAEAGPPLAAFLRNLFVMIKNLKLYPEGSRPLTQAVDALFGSMKKFFAHTDLLTLKLVKDVLHVNTAPCKGTDFGGAAADLARLMGDYSISSVTMTEKTTQKEIESFARAFLQPPEKTIAGPRYWSRFMEKNGIVNLDVIQQSFIVAREDTKEETEIFTRRKERHLDDAAMPLIKDVLRYLSASVDNIRRYPAESQLITFAIDSFISASGKILEREESFTLSEVDGNLLVNGIQANPKILGQAVDDVARMLKSRKISSVTIIRGLSREEVTPILRALAEYRKEETADSRVWEKVIADHQVQHIVIGHRTYAQAESVRMEPVEPRPDPVPQSESAPSGDVSSLLALPPEQLLEETTARLLPSIMENLIFDDRRDDLARLFDHIAANLSTDAVERRRKASDVLAEIVERVSALTQGQLLPLAAIRLPPIARGEKDLHVFGALMKVLRRAAAALVERGDYEPLVKILWSVGRHPEEEPRKAAQTMLKEFLGTGAFSPIFDLLASEDAQKRERAALIVEGCGEAAVGPLKAVVKRADKIEVKKAAVRALVALNPASIGELATEIGPYANPDDCAGILGAFPASDGRVDAAVANGMRHTVERVRRDAIRLFQQIPADRQNGVLRALLNDHNPVCQITALSAVENERHAPLASEIADLLKNAGDPKVREECCVAIGKIRDKASVAELKAVVGKKGVLGIVKGEPDDVRAAAAWALGNIGTSEAKDVLKALIEDKVPSVRSAARKAMQG